MRPRSLVVGAELAPPEGAYNYVFLAKIHVTLKPTVNDPQGITVQGGLHKLGYAAVRQARMGKYMELHIEESDQTRARALVDEMCRKLLANPVIEEYRFDLEEVAAATSPRT